MKQGISEGAGGGRVQRRAPQPAPGKVSRTAALDTGQRQAGQRQVKTAGAASQVTTTAPLGDWTADPWMDAAHRGTPMPARGHESAVQARGLPDTSDTSDAGEPESVHRAAAAGISGSGGALPYLDRIQDSFGPGHDVSGVRAHVGGAAAEASARMGAEAYATGERVGFRSQPDLHIAAHEAAHVVQQRAGVRLDGGVGQAGDAYERHADVVADAVVAGRSAESLLGGGTETASGPGAVQSRAAGAAGRQGPGTASVQFFGSREHKTLGDNAGGGAEYDLGRHDAASGAIPGAITDTPEYSQAFRLTHGDIVMLSGDLFSPRHTRVISDGVDEPDPDCLFALAGIASASPGQNGGTGDEVVYAIRKAIPGDPRFQRECTPEYPEGHPWSRVSFSPAVTAAVDARYLRRAAGNDEHFVDPAGTGEGPAAGDGRSAGGSYRALHEAALLMAYDQGKPANASAHEAAAQHFLTDHFAAGHLRTPRGSIRAHWSAIYPLFWNNIRNQIARDIANWINDNEVIGFVGSVDKIYTTVQAQVVAQTASIPPMGFDDLVSLVAHDFDNANGLWVVNDIGISWQLFGDDHLDYNDPDNRTREMCETAVRLGMEDIITAAGMGASKGDDPMSAEDVLESVRCLTAGPASPHATKYGPEQILPRLDPARADENGVQGWQQPNIDALWEAPVHSKAKTTFGDAISASMQEDGELKRELAGMAGKFPESQEAEGIFTVHPRRAFLEGFLAPLSADARAGLLAIIHFSPTRGGLNAYKDDAVMREINGGDGQAGMTEEELAGLTLEQKAERVRTLVAGVWSWCGEDEGETVIRLFTAAGSGQRRTLYEMVEGHRWEGDFRHGLLTMDDDLWNSLTSSQLGRLRTLIGD